MFFIPMGLALREAEAVVVDSGALPSAELSTPRSVRDSSNNLAAATIGNVIGGAVLVGLVYWFVYVRPTRST